MKVVIEVSGGVVQRIWSNDPQVVVEVVDQDNNRSDGLDGETILNKAIEDTPYIILY